MRHSVTLKHAAEFKAAVDVISNVSSYLSLEMESCGKLSMWSGSSDAAMPTVTATYPSPQRKRTSVSAAPVVFEFESALLSMACECAHHSDSVTVEWSGRETVQFAFTHASGRSTVVDVPISSMGSETGYDAENHAVMSVAHERRISSGTWTGILHKIVDAAASETVRVAFYDDGIDFRGEGGRLGVRVWHPSKSTPTPTPECTMCRIPARGLEPTSAMRKVGHVTTIGLSADKRDMWISSSGRDGLVVTFHISSCSPA